MSDNAIIYTEKTKNERTVKYPIHFDDIESAMQVSAFTTVIPKKKTRLSELLVNNLFKKQSFEIFENDVSTGNVIDIVLLDFLKNPDKFCYKDKKNGKDVCIVNVTTNTKIPSGAAMDVGIYAIKGWDLLSEYEAIKTMAMDEYQSTLRSYNYERYANSTFTSLYDSDALDVTTVATQILTQRNSLYGNDMSRRRTDVFEACINDAITEVLGYLDNKYLATAYKIVIKDNGEPSIDEYNAQFPSHIPEYCEVRQLSEDKKTYENVVYDIDKNTYVSIWKLTHEKMNEYIKLNYPKYRDGGAVEIPKCEIGVRDLSRYYDQKVKFNKMPTEVRDGVRKTSSKPYAWVRTRSKNGYLCELSPENVSAKPNVHFVIVNHNYNDWLNDNVSTGIYAHVAVAVCKKFPNYKKSFKKGLLNDDTTDGVDVNQECALMNSTLPVSMATDSYVDHIEGLHAYYAVEPNDDAFKINNIMHIKNLFDTDAHRVMLGIFAGTKENIVVNDDLSCSIHKDILANYFYWLINRKNQDGTNYYSDAQIKYIKDIKHIRNNVRLEIKHAYDRNLIKSKWDLSHDIPCSKDSCPEYRKSLEESDALASRTKSLVANVAAHTFAMMYSNQDAPSVIGMEKANFAECKKTKYERSLKAEIIERLNGIVDVKSLIPANMYANNTFVFSTTKHVTAKFIKDRFKNSSFWSIVDAKAKGETCSIQAMPTTRNLTCRLIGEYGQVMKKLGCMCDMKNIVANKVAKFNDGKNAFVRLVSPFYSSKKCSNCGCIHEDNRHGREFKCVNCGFTTDADHNASLNHKKAAQNVKIDENEE